MPVRARAGSSQHQELRAPPTFLSHWSLFIRELDWRLERPVPETRYSQIERRHQKHCATYNAKCPLTSEKEFQTLLVALVPTPITTCRRSRTATKALVKQ